VKPKRNSKKSLAQRKSQTDFLVKLKKSKFFLTNIDPKISRNGWEIISGSTNYETFICESVINYQNFLLKT